jgi:membrane protein
LRWASDLNTVIDNVLRIFPLVLSWLSFWLLYSIVPTTRVPNRDAVIGAFVAAVLFEAGKKDLRSISRCSRLISSFTVCWR